MTIEAARHPDESVGAWYWRRGVATDDWFMEDRSLESAAIPPLTKVYPGLDLWPLPYEPLGHLGDAGDVLMLPRGAPAPHPPRGLEVGDDASLSAFLLAAFGFCRHELGRRSAYPYHRTVPSARCRFPTQLYVLLPAAGRRPQGVYYFDALHHALALVAPGAAPEDLGLDPVEWDGAKPQAVFAVTSLFWNTACTYQHYAYRLCTQEAGLALGSLEVVAAAHGLTSRPCHHFDPERLMGALRLPEQQESPHAALPVWGGTTPRWEPSDGAQGGPLGFTGQDGFDPEHCRAVVVADRHARAARPHRAPPRQGSSRVAADVVLGDAGAPPPPDPRGRAPLPLAEALLQRNSGGQTFQPQAAPFERATLEWALACARAQDTKTSGATVRLLVVANTVDGLEPGAHVWRPESNTLDALRLGPVAERLGDVVGPPPIVPARAAPAVVFAAADHGEAWQRWGDAALSVLSAEAGAVVERLMLALATEGLAARILNAFRPSAFRDLTGVRDEQVGPLFSVFVGRRTAGSTVEFRLP